MDNVILLPAILGAVGGFVRGSVGLLKAMALKRDVMWSYWFVTVIIAMVIGVFIGIVFNFDYRVSLLAGYAGTDILESIYKSFKAQSIYVLPKRR